MGSGAERSRERGRAPHVELRRRQHVAVDLEELGRLHAREVVRPEGRDREGVASAAPLGRGGVGEQAAELRQDRARVACGGREGGWWVGRGLPTPPCAAHLPPRSTGG